MVASSPNIRMQSGQTVLDLWDRECFRVLVCGAELLLYSHVVQSAKRDWQSQVHRSLSGRIRSIGKDELGVFESAKHSTNVTNRPQVQQIDAFVSVVQFIFPSTRPLPEHGNLLSDCYYNLSLVLQRLSGQVAFIAWCSIGVPAGPLPFRESAFHSSSSFEPSGTGHFSSPTEANRRSHRIVSPFGIQFQSSIMAMVSLECLVKWV